jgi:hypothetical protein
MSGVKWKSVRSTAEGMQVFSSGEGNRATSFTSMNAHSSRSHAVFMIRIDNRKPLKASNID